MIDNEFPNGLKAAMDAAGKGPTEVSEAIGTNRQNVTRWSKGQRKLTVDWARKIAPVLGTTPEQLLLDTAPMVIRPEGPEATEVVPADNAPRFSEFGDFDVEVRGISVGGEDDDFYFNGKVSEHVRRPPGLIHKRGVFAVEVSNDSMVPRYEPGEIVYVQEKAPVAGDHVVVELYHPDEQDKAGKSFVKKFVRRTGRRIYCTQYNPVKDVEFDAGEVKAIYRVFPNRELFG